MQRAADPVTLYSYEEGLDGTVIGAVLLGTIQQVATVTISSAVNLLIVGLLLVGFVIIAPKGIVGLVQDFMRERASLIGGGLTVVSRMPSGPNILSWANCASDLPVRR